MHFFVSLFVDFVGIYYFLFLYFDDDVYVEV